MKLRKTVSAASAAVLLLVAAGCGSDDSADTGTKTENSNESGGSTDKLDAKARYAAASKLDCEGGVTMTATMNGEPFMEMATDGEITRFEMDGAAMLTMMSAAFGGLTGGADVDEQVLEEIAGDMSTSVVATDDTVYVSLLEDGEATWYAVPKDEFSGDDLDIDLEEMLTLCTDGVESITEEEYDTLYVDPDDSDSLIAPGVDLDEFSFEEEEEDTTTTSAADTDLSDDEIRELRDSDNRTILKLDGDRLVQVDSKQGAFGEALELLMDITYGEADVEIPADATEVDGAEFAEIQATHAEALDAKYSELFGFGDFSGGDESSFEEDFEFDTTDPSMTDTTAVSGSDEMGDEDGF